MARINRIRWLEPAEKLLGAGKEEDLIPKHRTDARFVEIDGEAVHIRDQKALKHGHMRLEGGWSREDFIEALNRHVFFWPGNKDGPMRLGRRYWDRYATENPVILRVSTEGLFSRNDGLTPEFSKYNSGAPRCSKGQPIPRGPNTFLSQGDADFTAGKVVEVAFSDSVRIPNDFEMIR